MGNLTVVVATYGDKQWIDLARRAIASAEPQALTVHVHGDTLHDARNRGLALVKTDWVVFLDADDELAPGYVEAMLAGAADLRVPAVSYLRRHHGPRTPGFPKVAGHQHDCTAECLPDGNWMVVGTAARAELIREVGGWRDWPCYEDWDLWLRCWKAGATIERIAAAVYTAHVRFDSRNRAPSRISKDQTHWAIHRTNFPEDYEQQVAA